MLLREAYILHGVENIVFIKNASLDQLFLPFNTVFITTEKLQGPSEEKQRSVSQKISKKIKKRLGAMITPGNLQHILDPGQYLLFFDDNKHMKWCDKTFEWVKSIDQWFRIEDKIPIITINLDGLRTPEIKTKSDIVGQLRKELNSICEGSFLLDNRHGFFVVMSFQKESDFMMARLMFTDMLVDYHKYVTAANKDIISII